MMLENFSKELEKGFTELSKISNDLVDKQKFRSELRTLSQSKQRAYLELGKRVFSICEEKDEIVKEDFLELISHIKNIDELIKNLKFNFEKESREKKGRVGGSVMVNESEEMKDK